jgi:lambda family phage portal protein
MIHLGLPDPPRRQPAAPPAPARKVRRTYDMGKVDRLTLDWVRSPLSPHREIGGALNTIKARSRDLAKNTFFGRNYVRLYRQNVIGAHGIRLQMRLVDGAGALMEEENAAIEKAFAAWSQWGQCTADRRGTLSDLMGVQAETYTTDGELLLELLVGFDNPFGFALRAWDTDLLDPEFDRQERGQNEIRASVELNQYGEHLAYHVLLRHPSELGGVPTAQRQRIRIPADRMVFVPRVSRPGQVRGVPEFTAIGGIANQLIGYWEAEVVAARMAAATMGFVKQDPESVDPQAPDEVTMDGAPGLLKYLNPGEDFTPWSPDHPTSAFPEFTKALSKGIAAGLGVSYMALCGDPAEANYSSARFASAPERDKWKAEHRTWIDQVYGRVFAAWLPQAVLRGQVSGLSAARLDEVLMAAKWQPRGFPYINPAEDMTALETALRLKLTTLTSAIAERGDDIVDVFAEIKREQTLMQDMGIEEPTYDGTAAAGQPADEPDDDESPDGGDRGDSAGTDRPPPGGDRARRPA